MILELNLETLIHLFEILTVLQTPIHFFEILTVLLQTLNHPFEMLILEILTVLQILRMMEWVKVMKGILSVVRKNVLFLLIKLRYVLRYHPLYWEIGD